MIPTNLATTQVKMNAMAFAHILSLADEQLKLKSHMLKNYCKSDEVFDRTIDDIHENNLRTELAFYKDLINNLKASLKAKGIS